MRRKMEKWTRISRVSTPLLRRICLAGALVLSRYAAPDRTGKISKFNFEAYAVLEASQSQSKSKLSSRVHEV